MNRDKQPIPPDADEELDDPYVHTVSTEEFVETVEQASQEKKEDVLTPNGTSYSLLNRASAL
ncbi:hypothetical protein GO730_39015 [Spirosoma sp. HMF3257]|uniref:Uncharacterized protein n=1 Tax=Spirosoma telluris TaxID=2183553 RepID=A0A327NCT6_9BACT|nr:hypothetical protein [Spirosoma telluris]RAI72882.1 hypothetical protein HMF3257_38930 [Spirosoma telluris]